MKMHSLHLNSSIGELRSTCWRRRACRCRPTVQKQTLPRGISHLGRASQDSSETQNRENPKLQENDEASSATRQKMTSMPRGNRTTPVPDSTDWVASTLTRRFGIGGGLAWVAVLTFGVVSEQIKTRREIASEKENTKYVADAVQKSYTTPEGIKITDLKLGGGAQPGKGDLIVLDFKAYADGVLFEDTKSRGKPIVFLYGSRPFTGGINKGVEIALATMKAGGKRIAEIPSSLGFGNDGAVIRPTEHAPDKRGVVPGRASLKYELDLVRVSIPPS